MWLAALIQERKVTGGLVITDFMWLIMLKVAALIKVWLQYPVLYAKVPCKNGQL